MSQGTAMAGSTRRRMRLGELLVAAGVLDETHLAAALAEQQRWGGKLGRVIVDMGLLSEDLMAKALARHLGLSRVDLDHELVPETVTRLLGVDLCERYGVFPLTRDDEHHVLRVAASDPTNYEAFDEIAFRTGQKVEPVIATPTAVDRAIRRYYYGDTSTPSATLDPAAYGLNADEQMLDLDAEPGREPPAAEAPALAAFPAAAGAPPADAATAEALARIEKMVNAEMRALRALVELLAEAGLIRREDYLAKLRGR